MKELFESVLREKKYGDHRDDVDFQLHHRMSSISNRVLDDLRWATEERKRGNYLPSKYERNLDDMVACLSEVHGIIGRCLDESGSVIRDRIPGDG